MVYFPAKIVSKVSKALSGKAFRSFKKCPLEHFGHFLRMQTEKKPSGTLFRRHGQALRGSGKADFQMFAQLR